MRMPAVVNGDLLVCDDGDERNKRVDENSELKSNYIHVNAETEDHLNYHFLLLPVPFLRHPSQRINFLFNSLGNNTKLPLHLNAHNS